MNSTDTACVHLCVYGNNYTLNSYTYSDSLNENLINILPEELKFVAPSAEATLFRLLLGKVEITNLNTGNKYEQNINYTSLPCESINNLTIEVFNSEFFYNLENNTFTIQFKNMMRLFINMRNRYFHFLVGQKQQNFLAYEYSMEDLLAAFNPHFLNWITIIYCTIIQHGFESFNE